MEQLVADQQKEREAHVQRVVSTLKSLADATEGNPRTALERLTAKGIVHGIKSIPKPEAPAVKEAASVHREAITLAAIAEKRIGAPFVDYDPQALHDLGFTPQECCMIMAAKLVLYDDAPFTDWHHFLPCALAMNAREVTFDVHQDLNVAEIAWAVDCFRYVDGHSPFSEEVSCYIAAIAKEEGLVVLPAVLAFAAPYLESVLSSGGRTLAGEVKARLDWPARSLRHRPSEAASIQLQRIASINQYVNGRHDKLLRELKTL